MARPARRWKNDCCTCQPTTARRCSTACSRTSQPLRTLNDRCPVAWPSAAYRPRPSGTPSTVRARPVASTHHHPAVAVATTPAAVTTQPADQGAHDPPAPGRGGMGRERAGVLDQPAGPASRPRRGGPAAAAGPAGRRRPRPGDQGVQPGGPHQPHAEPLGQRPAADPVDLQLGVPPGDQPAGGDRASRRAGPGGSPSSPPRRRPPIPARAGAGPRRPRGPRPGRR